MTGNVEENGVFFYERFILDVPDGFRYDWHDLRKEPKITSHKANRLIEYVSKIGSLIHY